MVVKSLRKGPFIIYGREGAGDFGEGATYFWQVAERGGHLFLARKNLKKPAKSIFRHMFLRDFGKGATYFWQVAERGGHLFLASRWEGGHLFLAASKNKISDAPPPMNNEPSLTTTTENQNHVMNKQKMWVWLRSRLKNTQNVTLRFIQVWNSYEIEIRVISYRILLNIVMETLVVK